MKKTIIILMVALIAFAFMSCETLPKTTIPADELTGLADLSYDNAGRLSRVAFTDTEGKLDESVNFAYNAKGFLVSMDERGDSEKVDKILKFETNENGWLVKYVENEGGKDVEYATFETTTDANIGPVGFVTDGILKMSGPGVATVLMQRYAMNGRKAKAEKWEFDAAGTCVKYAKFKNGKWYKFKNYTMDESGRVVLMEEVKNDEVEARVNYIYDEAGKIIQLKISE